MSRAFGLLVAARGKLYDRGVLATRRLDHPVISIGNITVGGNAKTPLAILLAESLRDAGFRPVVLSRGYRRHSTGVVIVSTGNGPMVPWETAGDEPFLIARRTRGVAVVVGADRYAAGAEAEQRKLGNLFIIDDGFQHRRLHRDVDLVSIDPAEWAAGERLLPFGTWREPASSIARAHAALIQSPGSAPGNLPIPSFTVEVQAEGLYRGDEPVSPDFLRGQPIAAFAGIAKPERFFNSLEKLGLKVMERAVFRDHHDYTAGDIASLQSPIRITTEKDALKLGSVSGLYHLRISARVPDLGRLLQLIREKL